MLAHRKLLFFKYNCKQLSSYTYDKYEQVLNIPHVTTQNQACQILLLGTINSVTVTCVGTQETHTEFCVEASQEGTKVHWIYEDKVTIDDGNTGGME